LAVVRQVRAHAAQKAAQHLAVFIVNRVLNGGIRTGRYPRRVAHDERRLALLPTTPAPVWDALMVSAPYMHALDQLP
jgi:hypothetical protein